MCVRLGWSATSSIPGSIPDFPGERSLPRGGLVPEVRELAEALCDALAEFEPGAVLGRRLRGADRAAVPHGQQLPGRRRAGRDESRRSAAPTATVDSRIPSTGSPAPPARRYAPRAPPSAPWPRSRTVPRHETRSSPEKCRWRRQPRSRRCPRTRPSCSTSRCVRVWERCGRKLAPAGRRRSRPTRSMRAVEKPGSSCTGRTASA